jgi:hypothetical protein
VEIAEVIAEEIADAAESSEVEIADAVVTHRDRIPVAVVVDVPKPRTLHIRTRSLKPSERLVLRTFES